MTRPTALALACLTIAACDGGGPTEPGWPRIKTAHGTVSVDPLADPGAVRAAIEAGFERAKTRTRDPAKLARCGVEGWTVVVNPWLQATGQYDGIYRVQIAPGMERVLDHEAQHLCAELLGLGSGCVRWQDHADGPLGGCNLDSEWGR